MVDTTEKKITEIKREKFADSRVIAIVYSKEWYEGYQDTAVTPLPIAVVSWLEMSDGIRNHIEGKTTHATFRNVDYAIVIFDLLVQEYKSTKGIISA